MVQYSSGQIIGVQNSLGLKMVGLRMFSGSSDGGQSEKPGFRPLSNGMLEEEDMHD